MNYSKIVIPILLLFISNAYAVSLQSRCEQLFTDALKEQLSPQDQILVVEVANLIGGKEKNRLLDEVLAQSPSFEVLERMNYHSDEVKRQKRTLLKIEILHDITYVASKLKGSLRILLLNVLLKRNLSPETLYNIVSSAVEIGGKPGIRILEKIIDKLRVHQESEKDIPYQVMQLISDVAFAAIKIGGEPGSHFFKNLSSILLPEVQKKMLGYIISRQISSTSQIEYLLRQDSLSHLRLDIIDSFIYRIAESGAYNDFIKELLENDSSPEVRRIIIGYIAPSTGIITGRVSYRNAFAYLKNLLEMNLSSQTIEVIAQVVNESPRKSEMVGVINDLERQASDYISKEAWADLKHLKSLLDSYFPPYKGKYLR